LLLAVRIARGPSRGRLLGGAALGLAATIGPLLLLQWHLWGHAFWTNYQAYWWGYLGSGLRSPYGFGPMPWDNVHTPLVGLQSLLQNFVRLDAFLVGVPLSVIAAFIGFWPARRKPEVLAVFVGAPLTFNALIFYFWPGLADTGPQLYHAAGAVLLPFVAAGLRRLTRQRIPALNLGAAVVVVSLLTFWPVQLNALYRVGRAGSEIPRLVEKRGIENVLIFTDLRPWRGGHDRCWVLGRPLPRPDLSDPVLYLVTQGRPVDLELTQKFFPDREPYLFKQVDGYAVLIPLKNFAGLFSLRKQGMERDLPP
ncbi:MAG: hypothetical protein ACTSXZ_04185, partial [Alphaproteobacteria bacterium]